MLWGVWAPSRCRGATESPLAGLHLVKRSKFPAAAKKITFCWGTCFSVCRNTPLPCSGPFHTFSRREFPCPSALCLPLSQHFPVPCLAPAGHRPGNRNPPGPGDPAALLGSEFWAICFPGTISEVQSGSCHTGEASHTSQFPAPFLPQKRVSEPVSAPVPRAVSLLVFPGPGATLNPGRA